MRRKGLLGAMLVWAVAGGVVGAGPAEAASRGFEIDNYTKRDMKLEAVRGLANGSGDLYAQNFEGRPADGAVLKAGKQHDWQLKYGFLGPVYGARLRYGIEGTKGDVWFSIKTSTFSNDSSCTITGITGYLCRAEGLRLSLRKGEQRCLNDPARNVDWSGCDLRGSYFYNEEFTGGNLEGVNLSRSYLAYSKMPFANLRDADLHDSDLTEAGFHQADLRGADLRDADLSGAQLIGTDLRGANMKGMFLGRGDASGAKCDDETVHYNGTKGHGTNCGL